MELYKSLLQLAADPLAQNPKAIAGAASAAVVSGAVMLVVVGGSLIGSLLSTLLALVVFAACFHLLCDVSLQKKLFGTVLLDLGTGTSAPSTGGDDADLFDLTSPATCAACGAEGGAGTAKLERCARCKSIFFCNRVCQKKVWKTHKTECREPSPVCTPTSGNSTKDASVEVLKALADATKAMADGDMRLGRRQAETAVKLAKKSQSTKQHAEALKILGQACVGTGDEHAAEGAYKSMVTLGKEQDDVVIEGSGHVGRGCVLRRKQKGEAEGLEIFEAAIKLARKHKLKDTSDEDAVDAVRAMETEARAQRGSCLLALGRLKDAIEELQEVVILRRQSVDLTDNMERTRRLGVALHVLAGAMKNSPESGGECAAVAIFKEAITVAKSARDVQTQLAAMTTYKELTSELSSAADSVTANSVTAAN